MRTKKRPAVSTHSKAGMKGMLVVNLEFKRTRSSVWSMIQ